MKPPLSSNYCSTINVADESVCEIPVNKVKRWIDDNDFKQNEDALRSESFQSLATSQMFAYIHKHDNNKQDSSMLLGYIDDTQMDKQSEICSIDREVNTTNNNLLSLYIDEAQLQKEHLTSDNSCQFNQYCEENVVFNIPHSNQTHNSLPDYIEESNSHYSKDEENLQRSLLSISLDSLTSHLHPARILDKLNLSKDSHTGSLPVLTPYVSNPIFAKSFDLFSCTDETADSIHIMNGNTDLTSNDNHGQKQPTRDTIGSGVNTGSRSHVDLELDTSTAEAIESSGYYESPSSKNTEMDLKITNDYSTSDLSLCSNRYDASVNASSSGNQSCNLGYIELPDDKTKCTYFESGDSSKNGSLSEFDFDIDSSQFCDTASTNYKCTSANPSVNLGYLPA